MAIVIPAGVTASGVSNFVSQASEPTSTPNGFLWHEAGTQKFWERDATNNVWLSITDYTIQAATDAATLSTTTDYGVCGDLSLLLENKVWLKRIFVSFYKLGTQDASNRYDFYLGFKIANGTTPSGFLFSLNSTDSGTAAYSTSSPTFSEGYKDMLSTGIKFASVYMDRVGNPGNLVDVTCGANFRVIR